MFECLESFEAQLDAEDDENAKGIRRGLAILANEPHVKLPSTMPKLMKPTQRKIFQLVGLYRLVDVLKAIQSDGYVSGINPRYSRMPEIGCRGSSLSLRVEGSADTDPEPTGCVMSSKKEVTRDRYSSKVTAISKVAVLSI
jgi:hypothetical protein